MNLVPVSSSAGQIPLAQRQRMLMAQALQERAATTATPAGKRGLAVGMAQLAAGLLGGVAEGQAIQQIEAGGQAVRDAQARMLQNYASALGGGARPAPGTQGGSMAGRPSEAGAGGSPNAAAAVNYLVGKGLSPMAAHGLVGGFQTESGGGLNTRAANPGDGVDGSTSIGVPQWNGTRAAAFRQFAAGSGRDPSDLGTQLDYVWQELNGPEKASLAALQAARTPEEATAAALGYERPAGWSPQNPTAANTYVARLANTNALASLGDDAPAAPPAASSRFAGNPSPTGAVTAPDLPAPNAVPAMGQGLPGDMTTAQAFGGGAPQAAPPAIPGSTFTPPTGFSGVVFDNGDVMTSPSSTPGPIPGGMQGAARAAMQPGMSPPALSQPQASGFNLQPSDAMNTRPWSSQGGMNDNLGSPSDAIPSSYGAIPPATGDPAAQSLAMALMQHGGGTAPTIGRNFDASRAYGGGPGATDAVLGADGGMAAAADTGTPAMVGASLYGQKLGAPQFADFSGDIRNGLPSPDVPVPPQRPPQSVIDALSGSPGPSVAGLAPPKVDSEGRPIVSQSRTTGARMPPPCMSFGDDTASAGEDGTPSDYADTATNAPASRAIQSAAPIGDMPAANAVPARGQGVPGNLMQGGPGDGISPIGKQASYQTPQAFNLAQSGGASPNLLATALASYAPGQPSSASSPRLRNAMASALMQNEPSVAPGSPFRQVMDGANMGQVAAQQYARISGDPDGPQYVRTDSSSSPGQGAHMALAQALNPGLASQGLNGGYDRSALQQDAASIIRSPYATPEERQFAMSTMMPSYSVKDMPNGDMVRINNLTGDASLIYRGGAKPDWHVDPTSGKEVNAATGEARDIPGGILPEYAATHDGLIYNKRTGRPAGSDGQDGGQSGYRWMTSEEKQAAGIPIDQPVQIGPSGKAGGTGSGVTVNMGAAQNEYQNAMSKAVAQRHVELMDGVEGAQQRARSLNEMSDAVQRIQAMGGTTGLGQSEVLRLQSAVNSAANVLGFQPFDISDKEVVGKLNKQIAASAARSLSTRGATNFDFQQMQSANPGLEMSPTANQRLIGLAQQAEQRNVDLGQGIRSYAAQQQARGAKANPADVETMITSYDAAHHFRDPITGQDVTANPRLPEFQGQGGQPGPRQGPATTTASPSAAQAQAASRTAPADVMAQARAAIAAGKSRAAVMQRLQSYGYNPAGL